MSWANDRPNIVRGYIECDELFNRPLELTAPASLDVYDGRAVTLFEEALDSAFFNSNFHESISKFKDPDLCPTEYLARLAIEQGVTVWYNGETEAHQRELIKTAKSIHRKAGTVTGLLESLRALDVNCSLTATDKPYEIVLLSNTQLTPLLTSRIIDRIELCKSERDTINIESQSHTNSTYYRARPTLARISVYSKSQFTD